LWVVLTTTVSVAALLAGGSLFAVVRSASVVFLLVRNGWAAVPCGRLLLVGR
jgi:hypothetical protein